MHFAAIIASGSISSGTPLSLAMHFTVADKRKLNDKKRILKYAEATQRET